MVFSSFTFLFGFFPQKSTILEILLFIFKIQEDLRNP